MPDLPPDASTQEVTDHLGKLAMVSVEAGSSPAGPARPDENKELRDELAQLRARVASLEKENCKLQDGRHRPVPRIVGDLERMTSTVAVAVLPVAGFTAVYRLTSRDMDYLTIGDHDPMLSSDYLWTVIKDINSVSFYFVWYWHSDMNQNAVDYICVCSVEDLGLIWNKGSG